MSWVGDIVRVFKYKCGQGHDSRFKMKTSAHSDLKKPVCSTCQAEAIYAGFENVSAIEGGTVDNRQQARSSFDQNGRKAFKVGNTYMSETKWNYMETGKIENVYTESFKEHQNKLVQKEVEKSLHDMEKHLNKGGGMEVDPNMMMDPSEFTPMQ